MLLPLGGSIYQPLDDDGSVVPAGTLTFTEAGVSTPKPVYHDADGEDEWSDPVVLDGAGRALIFLLQDGAYDITFKDANGATIWTIESILSPAPCITE